MKVQTPSWVDPQSKLIQESSSGEWAIGVLIMGEERQLPQPVSTTSLRDVSLPIPGQEWTRANALSARSVRLSIGSAEVIR